MSTEQLIQQHRIELRWGLRQTINSCGYFVIASAKMPDGSEYVSSAQANLKDAVDECVSVRRFRFPEASGGESGGDSTGCYGDVQ